MGLNIKNAETADLIRKLAAMTGMSLTSAVRDAVEKEIQRKRAEKEAAPDEGFAEWLMSIARETGPMLDDGRTSKELMDALYDDETGLPR